MRKPECDGISHIRGREVRMLSQRTASAHSRHRKNALLEDHKLLASDQIPREQIANHCEPVRLRQLPTNRLPVRDDRSHATQNADPRRSQHIAQILLKVRNHSADDQNQRDHSINPLPPRSLRRVEQMLQMLRFGKCVVFIRHHPAAPDFVKLLQPDDKMRHGFLSGRGMLCVGGYLVHSAVLFGHLH